MIYRLIDFSNIYVLLFSVYSIGKMWEKKNHIYLNANKRKKKCSRFSSSLILRRVFQHISREWGKKRRKKHMAFTYTFWLSRWNSSVLLGNNKIEVVLIQLLVLLNRAGVNVISVKFKIVLIKKKVFYIYIFFK